MATQATVLTSRVAPPSATTKSRIVAIDALRGTALILMALTHAAFFIGVGMQAESYGGQRVFLQGPAYWFSGLLTTLASPIFFFLAGTSLALLESSQQKRGVSQWEITRFMLIRALVILVLDLTVCNYFWMGKTPYIHVLTSIALAMIPLSVARILPTRVLLIGSVALVLIYQGILGVLAPQLFAGEEQSFLQALFLTYSYKTQPAVGFPVLGWGPIMWLGFVLGRSINRPIFQQPRTWLMLGGGMLGIWLVLRLVGGYGDLGPFQGGDLLPMFLVMSKAPPSLTYLTFKLGIAALIMAGFCARTGWFDGGILNGLVIIGRVSLFFYVMHIIVYHALAQLFLMLPVPAIPMVIYGYAVWGVGMVVLFVLSQAYYRLRQRHPQSWLRYL